MAETIFIPLTVGGGINTVDDFDRVLKCGADKVSVNSGAIRDPELITAAARKYGDQSFKAGEKENLADEMADVLWVLVCLANQTGVDLTRAVEANFAKKSARDAERHRNNPKL